ncbi:MAG: hypothetical protein N3B18_03955 [Desulfobacterota bacterium]|nr:hypothetical protein [Thermodesulfobacteriota bacterium]
MQRISIEQARPGMTVAKPVMNEAGVVLVGAGTPLTDSTIERLKHLEISSIIVKGRPLDIGVQDKPFEQVCAELDERFSLVSDDKLCGQIKEIIRNDLRRRREEEG